MTFEQRLLGEFIKIEKGLTYKGEFLSPDSEVGLIGMDSFVPGGGYKKGSEKPYEGPFKEKNSANAGDLILCCTDVTQDGSVLAAPLLVPEDLGGYSTLVYSHHVGKVVEIKEGLRHEFIYNFLRIPINRTRVAYGDTGTTVRALPYEVVYEQRIPVPTLEQQDQINSLIAMIDRKIELNAAIAANLERITQSTFRSWFVDFDPVKAKMVGEKPVGMDDATAALFPDSFEDSELGQIPSGWTVRNLGEICNIKQGRYLSPSQMVEKPEGVDTVPVIGGSGVLGYTSKSTFDFDVPLVTCRGSRCGLLQWGLFPSWVSNNAMAVTMQNSSKYSLFIYLFLKSTNLDNAITGSAQPQITITNLGYTRIVLPSTPILDAFSDLTEQMRDAVKSVNLESETLTKIREAILPRLISGELKIPEEMLVS